MMYSLPLLVSGSGPTRSTPILRHTLVTDIGCNFALLTGEKNNKKYKSCDKNQNQILDSEADDWYADSYHNAYIILLHLDASLSNTIFCNLHCTRIMCDN